MSINRPKDLILGLIFLVVGLTGILIARGYPFGTTRIMGPGFFPIMLGGGLVGLAAVLLVRSTLGPRDSLLSIAIRPLALILGGTLLFGLLIRPAGLIISIILMVVVGTAADRQLKLHQTLLLAAILAGASAFVFVYALGQPIPILGSWFENGV
ncbi:MULTISPECIES: tripartite tricarboxylate transporter TctB family protein [unclassified Chelatococcus]|uniref:tripartite tricarboxylate transporter TctB family protein n=1 Tax=unclassified Chelatococcus TaxID=2638111 RepID=UPI001BD06C87|nr:MULTISPECIES: tripartite tricarboxylate transporter TctB family protein [unclassified Chelatococcus]MBS7743509.1 tripartite tricarboxylate transporter TctB family protein [Chelatococcus sp. HY11]MBX3547379.1 tripartite tricarboxylate transporter TctB family protein [Chelatococcus sp.]CAH1662287.1 conserved membrane hypothetical protein [Hyphomicrobiales bacterium]CAH1687514.1 conserved membrane hypothetical protein [Hyphomicrobiales bacterium]